MMYSFLCNKEINKPSYDPFLKAGPEVSCCSKDNAEDLRQGYHLRNGSRRLFSRRRSNSFSGCTLPSIPEYPGFQDVKISRNSCRVLGMNQDVLAIGKKGNSSTMEISHHDLTLGRDTGCSLGPHSTRNRQNTNGDFVDQSLEDYFNQRLTDLRNYKVKGPNMKAQGGAEASSRPFPPFRTLRRRRSSSELLASQVKDLTESYIMEAQAPYLPLSFDPQESQGGLDFRSKNNYLDILILNAITPLEMLKQLNVRP
ncbi:uncharacterized protein LOC111718899 [Sarcophilus harrisii]|uniref:uncharacterized protein LOC111718899 n=1 Tax=Sarcophilus harrisii TaxID=9305 RepID=UPI001301D240|nr:uncharacterized protein LOC111718899 [Sarcophilus harrisii]